MKNHINFIIAIGFLLPQFLGLAIGLLQFMQPKPNSISIGFIKSFID